MQRITSLLASLLLMSLTLLTSCIREELPNAEADILSVKVEQTDRLSKEPLLENEQITIFLRPGTDASALALNFTLTPGATIEPASGTVRDFRTPQTYTVTSEDRAWKKTYTIRTQGNGFATRYSFETLREGAKERYHTFIEKDGEQISFEWASGNSAFSLTGAASKPEQYPTAQGEGYRDKGLMLVTQSTGWLGALFGSPLAAGNLFIGSFDAGNALGNPLAATKFGLPYYSKPLLLRGQYQYKPGEKYLIKGKASKEPITDEGNIYAVFYATSDTLSTLDGSNVLNHPSILAVAQIEKMTATQGWTAFELPFIWREGAQIDPERLKNGGYNLTIVFTSSREGAQFTGAVGSTLQVDEVELISE